ncbi:MAG: cysteine desulfurase family protein [Syntrophobacteraceae bacterium]
MERIYLDHNATTRPDSRVIEAMLPYLGERYGNPSSIHRFGQESRRALDQARRNAADLIGASTDEIVFTSGGTEADNQAIHGIADLIGGLESRIITTSIEHQAVLSSCRHLERQGIRVTYLPVDGNGRVNVAQISDLIDDNVILISIMLANNEVGTIQPIREAAAIARKRGILFHTDAVQAAGRIPIDVKELGVDLLSLSGHKIHGPKGVGALFVRSGIEAPVLIHGGHQERRRRAGTENVAAIVGFGQACRIARERIDETSRHTGSLRDHLQGALLARIPKILINGCAENRLPNTLNVTFQGADGYLLALNLDLMGIAVSTGSACQVGSRDPSYVLKAMGRSEDDASSCIRFSLGPDNTREEVDRVVEALVQLLPDSLES